MADAIPRRRNGFTSPYNMPQIYAWLALVFTVLHFLLGVTPILPLKASIPLTIFFVFLVGLVLLYGARAIAIDSMDVYLEQYLRSTRDGVVSKETTFKDKIYNAYNKPRSNVAPLHNDKMKQCWICDVQVVETSMHCKYCNKCVGKFDHHCMWLNTCVGERNYEDFFRVMLAIFAMQVFHLSASLALCIDIFLDGPTNARADSWWGTEVMNAFLIFFMVFDACSLVLLVQLVWFHLGLQRDQITTYQYIIRDHQKRRDKNKLQRELDNQRAAALHKAKAEGKGFEQFRLQMGEQTRRIGCGDCCDPLKMPTEVNDDQGFAGALGGGPDMMYQSTNSDGDEEQAGGEGGDNGSDDDEEAVAAEQAMAAETAQPETAREPGVTFLTLDQGNDIIAEPEAEAEEDGNSSQHDSKPWEQNTTTTEDDDDDEGRSPRA